jgi:hypothetical protein
MVGNTTTNRLPVRMPGACGGGCRAGLPWAGLLWAGLALSLALLTGCSTARERERPEGPLSLLRFRDAQTYAYFQHVYRSGNLYLDFRPALVVDAIVEDRRYRTLYVKMLGEQYLLPEAEVGRRQAEQEREFENRIAVLLFVYEGTTRHIPLDKKEAIWKLYLRDDDGEVQTPLEIVRLKEIHPTYLFLQKYFTGLDRWSQVYRVHFPKLSKAALGQPVGALPFQVILTGVKGTVVLQWDDAGVFYRTPETPGRSAP